MCAHGAAVQAYRAEGRHGIGLVVNLEPKYSASQSAEDLAATKRADAYMNRQYLDPALLGRCPAELRDVFGPAWREWTAQELSLASQPIDFIGVNYYTRNVVRHDASASPVRAAPVRQPGSTYTETGWEVYPQGLVDTLLRLRHEYDDPAIFITENGAAFFDPPKADGGRVRDPLRVRYLQQHLRAVLDAIDQGVNVRGYMVWSLMDNLEWSLGYSKRFGVVHVDFESLERTLKDSARYYARVVATLGRALAEEPWGQLDLEI